MDPNPSPAPARTAEHCTITEAVAWLAYGDEAIAARYGAHLGAWRHAGRELRQRDVAFATSVARSGLPGTEVLVGLTGHALLAAAQAWGELDEEGWRAAHDKLAQALRSAAVRSYRRGEVPSGFWADCTTAQHETAGYRIDRAADDCGSLQLPSADYCCHPVRVRRYAR